MGNYFKNHGKHKSIYSLFRHLDYIALNVSLLSAFLLYFINPLLSLIPDTKVSYIPFFVTAAFSIVSMITRIYLKLMSDTNSLEYYKNLFSALPHLIDITIDQSRKNSGEDLIVDIYAMRLTAASSFLHSILEEERNGNTGGRRIHVNIYHIDSQYLKSYSKAYPHIISPKRTLNHSSMLDNIIDDLESAQTNSHKISFEFIKYKNIPVFWCFRIDKEKYIKGYFKWNKEEANMIGPENRCFLFDLQNEPVTGYCDWIDNHFSSMDSSK